MEPDTFHVQRSITIQAPPEQIFAVLNDFHQSASWSPYEKKDPAMKRAFSGPETGKGAVYAFEGHGQQPYIGKVISLFIDCDKMIGKDFEVGLANLKALSETKLKASTS